MSDSVQTKLENFKSFVKEVSRNQDTIQEYAELSVFKMKALAYVLLIPQRNNLPMVVKEMQKKLDFDDEHLNKFQRYLEFFIEYLTGKGFELDNEAVSYEEQLEQMMKELDSA